MYMIFNCGINKRQSSRILKVGGDVIHNLIIHKYFFKCKLKVKSYSRTPVSFAEECIRKATQNAWMDGLLKTFSDELAFDDAHLPP